MVSVHPVGAAAVLAAIVVSARLLPLREPGLDAGLLGLGVLGLGLMFRTLEWPARLFLSAMLLTSVTYLAVLLEVTFAGSLPALGLGLSMLLLLLEILGFALSAVFAFEMADALGRKWQSPTAPPGSDNYRPRVCLQVPAYNEPPDLVIATLESLATLDYSDYIVQVVVNNTTDPLLWQPIEAACRVLGARFHFVNLPRCEGFKAGALNRATALLGEDVELVGIVDADYVVRSEFLTNCVPHFADPTVAFLQTPQHYREWSDSPYLRGLFYAYRYFFDVTMVARARVNAIIFGGTMGLIRLRVLRDIGGWAEWCITEDAEASLRILAEGWKSVYLGESYGQGLMPLDFDGLRRQRFRWAFGGVQILRRHFGLLVGLKRSKLTMWQRYHYLVGGLGWFGDLVGVGLSAFLLLTAPLLVIGQPLFLRQLVGLVLTLPIMLLVGGLLRLAWALKVATGARWRDVLVALLVMLALGWTVTQACVRGLFASKGVFLRTPKVRTPSRLARAVRATLPESVVAILLMVLAAGLVARAVRPLGLVVAVLAAWQAVAWGSAPTAALLAQEVRLTPLRLLLRRSPQKTGERPWGRRVRRLTLAPLLAVLAVGLLAPAIATSTADERAVENALAISPARPIPVLAAAPPSTPSPSPSSEALRGPSGSPVITSVSSAVPSRAPIAAPTPTPTSAPTPASGATATPSSGPTAQPTSPATPSSRPSISPTYPSQRPTPR